MPEPPSRPIPQAPLLHLRARDAATESPSVVGPDAMRLLEAFVDELQCGAVLVSGDTIKPNHQAEAIIGCARGELRTLDEWFAYIYGSQESQHRLGYEQAQSAGRGWRPMPITVPGTSDESRQVEITGFRFDGVYEVWMLHDQTLKRDAEQLAIQRDEDLRAVVDTATDAIVTIDEHGTIQRFNRAAERMFGYAAPDAIGASVKILMPEPHASAHGGYVKRYLDTGEARVIGRGREVLAKRKDGTTFPVDLALSEIDHRRRFTAIIRDLTDRKALERRLIESRLVARRHLAQELHDGMGGTMAGIGMLAATLATQLHRADSALANRADELVGAIDDANEQLRKITRGLLPVEVVPEGLMEALQQLVDQTEATHGLICRFECEVPVYIHDATAASQLFRIGQEAVTNAVRHGRSKHLTVTLSREADLVTLEVEDDGIGFEEIPKEKAGLGLVSMEHRCTQLGGQWSIGAGRDGGVVVTCTVACPPESETHTTTAALGG